LYFIGQGIFEPKKITEFFSNFTNFFQNYWPKIEKSLKKLDTKLKLHLFSSFPNLLLMKILKKLKNAPDTKKDTRFFSRY